MLPKILLVDDELPIREWLSYCLQSTHDLYTIVGSASNGSIALSLFEENLPDILITDIRMPVMDGIELVKRIKEIKPSTYVIVITCMEDFEYTRSAFQYGANEYILKTEITSEKLYQLIQKGTEYIQTHVSAFLLYEDHSRKRRQLLQTILIENPPTLSKEVLKKHYFSFQDQPFFCAVVQSSDCSHFSPHSVTDRAISNLVCVTLDNNQLFLCANMTFDALSTLIAVHTLQQFCNHFISGTDACMGVSKVYSDPNDFPKAVQSAYEQIQISFYKGMGSICQATLSTHTSQHDQLFETMVEQLTNQLHGCDMMQGIEVITTFLDSCYEHSFSQTQRIKQITSFMLGQLTEKSSQGDYQHLQLLLQIQNAQTYAHMRKAIDRLVVSLQMKTSVGYSKNIANAVEYVQKNFHDACLLTDVANHIHLSPEYVSRLFKEEIGITYNRFVTNIRMQHAKQLLLRSDQKIYDIAEQCGYTNIAYFSKAFKKHVGINPITFRENHFDSSKH